MKNSKGLLFVICYLLFVICSKNILANDAVNLNACNGCTYQQMRSVASRYAIPDEFKNVHVYDVISNKVLAFRVMAQVEPGMYKTWVTETEAESDVVEAVALANSEIKRIQNGTRQDSETISKVRELFPGVLPSLVSVEHIPSSVVHSARDISIGNTHHLSVSHYLSQRLNISITNRLVNMILAQYGHAVIAVFEGDGTLMIFIPKLSSIPYEPVDSVVIDSDGNIIYKNSDAVKDTSRSGGSAYLIRGTNIVSMPKCSSWIIIKGTRNADGAYCEEYSYN